MLCQNVLISPHAKSCLDDLGPVRLLLLYQDPLCADDVVAVVFCLVDLLVDIKVFKVVKVGT